MKLKLMLKKWIKTKKKRLTTDLPLLIPSGSCVVTEKNFYYIKNTTKFPILTERVLKSWRFVNIIPLSESNIKNYMTMSPLGFRDGTLIQDISDGKIYYISNNTRRHIKNPDVLRYFSLDYIILASSEEVNFHKIGEDLVTAFSTNLN